MQFLFTAIAVITAAVAGGDRPGGPSRLPHSHLAQDAPTFGWCYDAARDLVSRRPVVRCEGRIVDDAEAARLRQKRDRRVMRALSGPRPFVPGGSVLSSGSGFVVSRAGHVLTNQHVVRGCGRVSVEPAGEREFVASVVAADPGRDLALLKAPIPAAMIAAFGDAGDPLPAADIAVAGYPELGLVTVRPVLRTGHVYIGGDAGRDDRYLLKMDIRRGNSGGPVLDRGGRVVGVVVAKVDTPAAYAATGQILRDVGFAIRPEVVLAFLAEHGVQAEHSDRGADLDDAALMDRVRGFIARIRCWR